MWSKLLLCYPCWKAIKTGIRVWSYSPQTCQYYILEIKKKRKKKEALCLLSVPAGARAHLCRSLEVNWILKGEKYWEIGGSDAESGMILAKGGPVYSCYCYGGDELIWYLALINDEGLCGLNLKAASGHFYAAGLYFSRAHPPHLSHDGFTASGFHFKDVFIVKKKRGFICCFLLYPIVRQSKWSSYTSMWSDYQIINRLMRCNSPKNGSFHQDSSLINVTWLLHLNASSPASRWEPPQRRSAAAHFPKTHSFN